MIRRNLLSPCKVSRNETDESSRMSGLDLYEDLLVQDSEKQQLVSIHEVNKEKNELKVQNEMLLEQLHILNKKIDELYKDNTSMKENFDKLLATAKIEVERKNKLISSLTKNPQNKPSTCSKSTSIAKKNKEKNLLSLKGRRVENEEIISQKILFKQASKSLPEKKKSKAIAAYLLSAPRNTIKDKMVGIATRLPNDNNAFHSPMDSGPSDIQFSNPVSASETQVKTNISVTKNIEKKKFEKVGDIDTDTLAQDIDVDDDIKKQFGKFPDAEVQNIPEISEINHYTDANAKPLNGFNTSIHNTIEFKEDQKSTQSPVERSFVESNSKLPSLSKKESVLNKNIDHFKNDRPTDLEEGEIYSEGEDNFKAINILSKAQQSSLNIPNTVCTNRNIKTNNITSPKIKKKESYQLKKPNISIPKIKTNDPEKEPDIVRYSSKKDSLLKHKDHRSRHRSYHRYNSGDDHKRSNVSPRENKIERFVVIEQYEERRRSQNKFKYNEKKSRCYSRNRQHSKDRDIIYRVACSENNKHSRRNDIKFPNQKNSDLLKNSLKRHDINNSSKEEVRNKLDRTFKCKETKSAENYRKLPLTKDVINKPQRENFKASETSNIQGKQPSKSKTDYTFNNDGREEPFRRQSPRKKQLNPQQHIGNLIIPDSKIIKTKPGTLAVGSRKNIHQSSTKVKCTTNNKSKKLFMPSKILELKLKDLKSELSNNTFNQLLRKKTIDSGYEICKKFSEPSSKQFSAPFSPNKSVKNLNNDGEISSFMDSFTKTPLLSSPGSSVDLLINEELDYDDNSLMNMDVFSRITPENNINKTDTKQEDKSEEKNAKTECKSQPPLKRKISFSTYIEKRRKNIENGLEKDLKSDFMTGSLGNSNNKDCMVSEANLVVSINNESLNKPGSPQRSTRVKLKQSPSKSTNNSDLSFVLSDKKNIKKSVARRLMSKKNKEESLSEELILEKNLATPIESPLNALYDVGSEVVVLSNSPTASSSEACGIANNLNKTIERNSPKSSINLISSNSRPLHKFEINKPNMMSSSSNSNQSKFSVEDAVTTIPCETDKSLNNTNDTSTDGSFNAMTVYRNAALQQLLILARQMKHFTILNNPKKVLPRKQLKQSKKIPRRITVQRIGEVPASKCSKSNPRKFSSPPSNHRSVWLRSLEEADQRRKKRNRWASEALDSESKVDLQPPAVTYKTKEIQQSNKMIECTSNSSLLSLSDLQISEESQCHILRMSKVQKALTPLKATPPRLKKLYNTPPDQRKKYKRVRRKVLHSPNKNYL